VGIPLRGVIDKYLVLLAKLNTHNFLA